MTTKLIQELVGLAVEKNWNFDGLIDVKFIGLFNHVSLEVRFDNGDEFKTMINIDNSDAPDQLQAAIDKVKAL